MADSLSLSLSLSLRLLIARPNLSTLRWSAGCLSFRVAARKEGRRSSRGWALCCAVIDAKKAAGGAETEKVEGGHADADGDVFSITTSNQSDVDYLGESTKGDLNVKQEVLEAFGEVLG